MEFGDVVKHGTDEFNYLTEVMEFDISDVPKHGKGWVTPTATSPSGDEYYLDTKVVWDYNWGIEDEELLGTNFLIKREPDLPVGTVLGGKDNIIAAYVNEQGTVNVLRDIHHTTDITIEEYSRWLNDDLEEVPIILK